MHRLIALLTMTMLWAVPAYADKGGRPHEGSSGVGREAALAAAQPPGQAADQGAAAAQADSPGRSAEAPRSNARSGETGRRAAQGTTRRQSTKAPGAKRQGPKPKKAGQRARGARPVTGSSVKRRGSAGKTTICHATGSDTNPYVLITVSDNALPAHRRHHDGRDIVPAPAGGCPGADSAATAGSGADQRSAANGAGAGDGEVRGASAGGGRSAVRSAPGGPALGYGVLGATVSFDPMTELAGKDAAGLRTAEASPSRDGFAGLPFTGLQLAFIICSGLAALMLGTALFRATRPRPPSGIHPFG